MLYLRFTLGVCPYPYPCINCQFHVCLRNAKDENLFGNASSCKRLEILLIGFAQGLSHLVQKMILLVFDTVCLAAASAYNHTLEPLDKKVSKYIGGNPIRVDGKPRASGILDTVCLTPPSY
jgi:acid phosphatase